MRQGVVHPGFEAVKAIHAEVLAAHGGAPGLRDEALLRGHGCRPASDADGRAADQ
jgi:prophage maintenance system killer protein